MGAALAEDAAELERLDAELAMHDERYYNDAMPTIDDAEHDGLRARYEAIERAHGGARGARAREWARRRTARADRVRFRTRCRCDRWVMRLMWDRWRRS